MTQTDVAIIPVTGTPTEMYLRYNSQTKPQGCYIELSLNSGALSASTNSEIGNAIPFGVWNGVVRRYSIPALQPESANALMDDLKEYAQIVLDNSKTEWDGSNFVGKLSDAAQQAEERIEKLCREAESDVFVEDAADSLCVIKEEIVAKIKAGESVESIAEYYQGDGRFSDQPYLENLDSYLEHLAVSIKDSGEDHGGEG